MNNFVEQVVTPSGWRDLGIIETAQTALATTQFAVAVAEALAAAKIIKAEIPHGAANVELRFYGTAAEGNTNILNIYGKRDHDGYYQLLATLTLVTGTAQKGAATELWVDGVTEDADFTPGVAGGAIHVNDNSIARYYFKPGGYKGLLIIATTLASTNIGAEIAGYAA